MPEYTFVNPQTKEQVKVTLSERGFIEKAVYNKNPDDPKNKWTTKTFVTGDIQKPGKK